MSNDIYKINLNPFKWSGVLGRIAFLVTNIIIFVVYLTPLTIFCRMAYYQIQAGELPINSPDGILFLILTLIYHYCVFCVFKKRILDAFTPILFLKPDDKRLKLKENLFAGVIALAYTIFSIRSICMTVRPAEAWFWNIIIIILVIIKGKYTSKKNNK